MKIMRKINQNSFLRRFRRHGIGISKDYSALVDRIWYSQRFVDNGGDPLADYLERGRRNHLPPNPYFNPRWYLDQNPDVAASNEDPLQHYIAHGWKELRDPSNSFSTRYYLESNKDVRESGVNPLRHFIEHGRNEGRSPHPLLDSVDVSNPSVAIILLCFNAPQPLMITIDSLIRSRCAVPMTVYLIDNGSRPDVKSEVIEIVEDAKLRRLDIQYTDSPINLGFSGGNNVCIRQALQAEHTHICILNSDTVVTDGWLDRLLSTCEPVVGPVSNAVGNEQTIPINYETGVDHNAWHIANNYAQRRWHGYKSSVNYTNFLGFFCALIRRDIFERIGLLDERFFPGSYEDDDYCLGLINAGYCLAIARSVFIHHFGSASFSILEFDQRLEIANINRTRFEEKHGCAWQPRTHLLLTSWSQDEALSCNHPESSSLHAFTRAAHHQNGVDLVRRLQDATEHFRRESARGVAALTELEKVLSGKSQPDLGWVQARIKEIRSGNSDQINLTFKRLRTNFGDHPDSQIREMNVGTRRAYAAILGEFWSAAERHALMTFSVLVSAQSILVALANIISASKTILIFANLNPDDCDERDGYVQRVMAMDNVMSFGTRIYVFYHDDFRNLPALEDIGSGRYLLCLGDKSGLAEALLNSINSLCSVYVHSVLSLTQELTRRTVTKCASRVIYDVHGSVPEEFRMYNDYFSAQIYEDFESEIFSGAGTVVCVSQAMADHMSQKHGRARQRPIVCPIFVNESYDVEGQRKYRIRPRIIYAGGIQRWQQIPKMLDLVVRHHERFDFTLYTPDSAYINSELLARGLPHDSSVCVASVTPAEVQAALPSNDFGLLLREDSIVNRVSCPTKLVEYLLYGVVPIMEAEVGDFNLEGMRYVTLADFSAGILPDRDVRRSMALHNQAIIRKLQAKALQGLDQVRAVVQSLGGSN